MQYSKTHIEAQSCKVLNELIFNQNIEKKQTEPVCFLKKNLFGQEKIEKMRLKYFDCTLELPCNNAKLKYLVSPLFIIISDFCRTQEGPAYTWLFNFHTFVRSSVRPFVRL